MTTDLEIARRVPLKAIADIGQVAGVPPEALIPYGRAMAKIDLDYALGAINTQPQGRLILVTATNPTPAGEGKTTTTIGLADALRRRGHRAAIALREPSLGPCFGRKGGATGGGYAQVAPMEAINLHFTGDFHAITAAHNLLASMIDNHMYWGSALDIDPDSIVWNRVLDANDRALRHIRVGAPKDAITHDSSFDITVASEVMAVFCLAKDRADLEARLSHMVIGTNRAGQAITAHDIGAVGSMMVLLNDALAPNLVQSLEGTPAFLHGGPFANIAHGCNSVLATRTALAHADYVVTEAGFGADLGAEKFLHIKCRMAGLWPQAAVIVATVRALKMHGGVAKDALGQPDVPALKRGFANLQRHIANMKRFGLPVIVAINHFTSDADDEWTTLQGLIEAEGVPVALCRHWAQGGAGADALAALVEAHAKPTSPQFLYDTHAKLADKISIIATTMYGAAGVDFSPLALQKLAAYEAQGYGHMPVCMAKTQESFSSDPKMLGAPTGHTLEVRDVRLSAGAGFVVALCGTINTMPGLPRSPAALHIGLDAAGRVVGLS